VTISTRTIAGTGLFALDVVVRLDGSRASPTLGGSAGNVLSILGALGWGAAPVGVLGDDPAGRVIRHDFEQVGADMRLLRWSQERHTPVIYQQQLDRAADECDSTHRFTFACPECGERRRPQWKDDPDVSEVGDHLPKASVFYMDRPTRLGVALAEHYAARGALVVFEPSAIGDDVDMFANALRTAHIVKYSDERLGELKAFDLRRDAIEIQTRGSHGLRFRSMSFGRNWSYLPAFPLPFLHDTAGAGDWCTAGMLHELFRVRDEAKNLMAESVISRALAFGQVLSTLNCMTEGARGLLSAWSVERIVDTARMMTSGTRANANDLVDRTFLDFARELGDPHMATTSGRNGLDCCSPP